MAAADALPFAAAPGGVRVFVRLQPGARREGVAGIEQAADGTAVIRAAVTAPPAGGRANARLIAFLAKTWRLPKSAFEITAGARARRKTLLLKGEPQAILPALHAWLDGVAAK